VGRLGSFEIAAICALLAAAPAHVQTTGLLSRLKLRASVLDKNAVEKPALFQATFPDGKPATYAIDAGLTLELVPSSSALAASWKIGPYLEYHRRTQLTQPQDSLLTGVSVLSIAGDPASWSHYTQAKVEYKRDAVKDTESFQGAVLYMPLVPRHAIGLARGPSALRILWQPAVGVEWERIAQAPMGKPTGSVARLSAGVDVAFYPADDVLKKRLELVASWTYWRDAAERSGLDDGDDSHRLWKGTVSYALDADAHASVGLELLDGENPSKGLADQRYAQLALRLKF
jgi:hypothetical protein